MKYSDDNCGDVVGKGNITYENSKDLVYRDHKYIREDGSTSYVYFPHIGNPEWDALFYHMMIINENTPWEQSYNMIYQGPWKMRHHCPLDIAFAEEWIPNEWALGGMRKKDIQHFIATDQGPRGEKKYNSQKIKVDEIASKPDEFLSFIDEESGGRYEYADTSFPLYVIEGLSNPLNRKYYLVDGRRRLHKITNVYNRTEAECYVIPVDIAKQWFWEYKIISYLDITNQRSKYE